MKKSSIIPDPDIDRVNAKLKQSEEALRRSKECFSKAEKIAHLGYWEWDMATNELIWSDEVYRLYGLDPEKVVPTYETVVSTLSAETRDWFIKAIDDAINNNAPFEGEYALTRPDGSLIHTHTIGEVFRDKNGKPLSMFGVVQDITERKKADKLLLENLRLEAADKAKSEFLSAMSHELRTPLNAVIGFSELLKMNTMGTLNEKQENYVDNIRYGGKHLLNIITDILDLSKIEAGKMELTIEKTSLPEAIDETINLMNEDAIKKKVTFIKELDPQIVFIEADKQRLKQIFFNLLSNAVKFSKEEGGTVTIAAKKERDMARISVSDTGIGIIEEDLKKLFREFEQLDSGIGRKYGGTGLGLAISKKLVELHGGKIRVESEFGKWTSFIFLLPMTAHEGGFAEADYTSPRTK